MKQERRKRAGIPTQQHRPQTTPFQESREHLMRHNRPRNAQREHQRSASTRTHYKRGIAVAKPRLPGSAEKHATPTRCNRISTVSKDTFFWNKKKVCEKFQTPSVENPTDLLNAHKVKRHVQYLTIPLAQPQTEAWTPRPLLDCPQTPLLLPQALWPKLPFLSCSEDVDVERSLFCWSFAEKP